MESMKIWESATLYFLLKFPKLCQVYEIKKKLLSYVVPNECRGNI